MLKISLTFDQMTNSRNIKLKALMAKWLLISTIVVSLFAPSCLADQSVLQQQKTQTELVSFNKPKSGYRAAIYQIKITRARTQFIYASSLLHTYHLLAYGRLSKIKFDQLLRKAICLKICHKHYRFKIISQDPGEDLSDCLIA